MNRAKLQEFKLHISTEAKKKGKKEMVHVPDISVGGILSLVHACIYIMP